MTLSTDTAALLLRSVDALRTLIEPAPYALLTPDERRSALRQLLVTTETAAKLAELAHADVPMPQYTLGGETPACDPYNPVPYSPVPDQVVAESRNPSNDVLDMVQELERMRVESEGVRGERKAALRQAEKSVREGSLRAERSVTLWRAEESWAESEALLSDVCKAEKEAGRLVALMKAVEAEMKSVGELLEGSDRQTERLLVELDGVKSEKVAAELHVDWLMVQLHEVRGEYVRVEDDKCRTTADAEWLMGKVKAIEKEIGRCIVKKDKMKAEVERVENALERSMQETERLRLELDGERSQKPNIEAEVEGVKVEVERLRGEMELLRVVKH